MGFKIWAKTYLVISLTILYYVVSASETPPARSGGSQSPPGSTGTGFHGNGTTNCSKDPLKLDVCANLLGGAVVIEHPKNSTCCILLAGLADLELEVCLCTAIKANVLGLNLNVPLSLNLILNLCERIPPIGLAC